MISLDIWSLQIFFTDNIKILFVFKVYKYLNYVYEVINANLKYLHIIKIKTKIKRKLGKC